MRKDRQIFERCQRRAGDEHEEVDFSLGVEQGKGRGIDGLDETDEAFGDLDEGDNEDEPGLGH